MLADVRVATSGVNAREVRVACRRHRNALFTPTPGQAAARALTPYLLEVSDAETEAKAWKGLEPTPGRRWAVVLNVMAGSGGAGGATNRVRSALAAAGVDATVWTSTGGDAAALARRAAADPSFDAVVAAGGDGTVSAVAGVLAGTEKALAVLPLGTLNHFAKDLGVPADLAAAARAPSRAFTWKEGRISLAQIEALRGEFCGGAAGNRLHVVVAPRRHGDFGTLERRA